MGNHCGLIFSPRKSGDFYDSGESLKKTNKQTTSDVNTGESLHKYYLSRYPPKVALRLLALSNGTKQSTA